MNVAIDLADAVAQTLRANNTAVTFGDTWNPATQTGIQKFFGDWGASVPEPYAVIEEVGETYQYMTAQAGGTISYIADGQLSVTILQSGRTTARQLGMQVAKVLNDNPVPWTNESTMYLRLAMAKFMPIGQVGPGIPAVFCRVLLFSYEYSSYL